MTEITLRKKDLRRGGGVLLDKYGPDHFKKMALKKAKKEKEARDFFKKHNKTK